MGVPAFFKAVKAEIFAKYLHGLGNMSDKELDLYFDYFKRLTRDLAHPDKVICFDVPSIDVLLARIRTRGREEETRLTFAGGVRGPSERAGEDETRHQFGGHVLPFTTGDDGARGAGRGDAGSLELLSYAF